MDEATRAPTIRPSAIGANVRNHFRNASSPTQHRWRQNGERQPLIRRRSLGPVDEDGELASPQPVAGGTVLGIHNLAIVMPQFIVCLYGLCNIYTMLTKSRRLRLLQARFSGSSIAQTIRMITTPTWAKAVWLGSCASGVSALWCGPLCQSLIILADEFSDYRLEPLSRGWFLRQRLRRTCAEGLVR